MPDYARLIDAETWAFIECSASFYPPDAIESTPKRQREIYDRMCRAFHAGYPDGVSAETTAIDAQDRRIPIRIYRCAPAGEAATVLYFHGGSFMLGGLESHDDICAELCASTGYAVVSVDYRLAPEHTHPAAFDDALSAFHWAARTDDAPVVLMGDSAGGNLAAAVAHATRDHPHAAIGQVLIYPALGGDTTTGSYVTHAEAPMLTLRDIFYAKGLRTGGVEDIDDVSLAPLSDTDFSRLPPTVIVTAECDPLSSDGETYRDAILAADGRAVWFEEKGLVHGYLRARHSVARARRSFDRIGEVLRALGRGQWPYALTQP